MATIHEIAKKAGVSPGLVSLALNGKPRVSPQTAERILRIADELGYRHNSRKSAQAGILRFIRFTKGTNFLRESHSSFFSEYFEGAESYLYRHGFRTEVTSYTGNRLADAVRDLKSLQVQGAIILATELVAEDMEAFASPAVPLVFLDTCHPFLPHDYCTMNNMDAVNLAIRHFCEMGHRSIGMVASLLESGNFNERHEAFCLALSASGIKDNPRRHYSVTPETAPAVDELIRACRKRKPPPALFCFTDSLAYACIQALHSLNIRVPEDVSIIGFDDLPPSAIMQPGLTTVGVPTHAMGMSAARMLRERLLEPDGPYEKIRLGCKLHVRKSVCKRP